MRFLRSVGYKRRQLSCKNQSKGPKCSECSEHLEVEWKTGLCLFITGKTSTVSLELGITNNRNETEFDNNNNNNNKSRLGRRYIYVVVQLRILAAFLELLSYPLEGLEGKWQKREETAIVSAALIFYFWIICLIRITQKFVVLQWVAKVSERTITFIKFSVKTFIYLLFSHISILPSVYKMLTNFKQHHSRKG